MNNNVLFLGKVAESTVKLMSLFSWPGRQVVGGEQTHVQNVSKDEVDDGNSSEEEGSVEQEIRISVRKRNCLVYKMLNASLDNP